MTEHLLILTDGQGRENGFMKWESGGRFSAAVTPREAGDYLAVTDKSVFRFSGGVCRGARDGLSPAQTAAILRVTGNEARFLCGRGTGWRNPLARAGFTLSSEAPESKAEPTEAETPPTPDESKAAEAPSLLSPPENEPAEASSLLLPGESKAAEASSLPTPEAAPTGKDEADGEGTEAPPSEAERPFFSVSSVPGTYYACNEAAFREALENGRPEKDMDALIPGSRWVRLEVENEPRLFGVIFDSSEEPLYLCHGFSRPWSESPPPDLGGYCQWIPRDCEHPHREGFWVLYVNARTGERIK